MGVSRRVGQDVEPREVFIKPAHESRSISFRPTGLRPARGGRCRVETSRPMLTQIVFRALAARHADWIGRLVIRVNYRACHRSLYDWTLLVDITSEMTGMDDPTEGPTVAIAISIARCSIQHSYKFHPTCVAPCPCRPGLLSLRPFHAKFHVRHCDRKRTLVYSFYGRSSSARR